MARALQQPAGPTLGCHRCSICSAGAMRGSCSALQRGAQGAEQCQQPGRLFQLHRPVRGPAPRLDGPPLLGCDADVLRWGRGCQQLQVRPLRRRTWVSCTRSSALLWSRVMCAGRWCAQSAQQSGMHAPTWLSRRAASLRCPGVVCAVCRHSLGALLLPTSKLDTLSNCRMGRCLRRGLLSVGPVCTQASQVLANRRGPAQPGPPAQRLGESTGRACGSEALAR